MIIVRFLSLALSLSRSRSRSRSRWLAGWLAEVVPVLRTGQSLICVRAELIRIDLVLDSLAVSVCDQRCSNLSIQIFH